MSSIITSACLFAFVASVALAGQGSWPVPGPGRNAPQTSFVCGSSQVQDSDGNYYDTVVTANECWLATNLNVGTRINGATGMTNNSVTEKYCYSDSEANCTAYGALYQWDEAMQYVTTESAQGLCPDDWHIPSDAEWYALENYFNAGTCSPTRVDAWGCPPAGTALQTAGVSGLNMPLSGYRTTGGSFTALGSFTTMLSSSESSTNAWRRELASGNNATYRTANSKAYGRSIRCIRD